MNKNLLAVAIVVALSACSSGSDDDNNDTSNGTAQSGTNNPGNNTNNPPANNPGTNTPVGNVDAPTGGGEGAAAGTKAGTYIGSFGAGQGVYVINNANELAGLALFDDGSAQSLFGPVGDADAFDGELRQYLHNASEANVATESFASVAGAAANLPITVNIVNGQSIVSTAESATAVNLAAAVDGDALAPATAADLAGTWDATNTFCDNQGENCQTLSTSMTFSGVSVTGSTTLASPDGTLDAPLPIVGGITEFGDAAIIEFNWNNVPGYTGLVFFNPANDGTLLFVGENNEAVEVPVTISAVMNRVP